MACAPAFDPKNIGARSMIATTTRSFIFKFLSPVADSGCMVGKCLYEDKLECLAEIGGYVVGGNDDAEFRQCVHRRL